MSALQLPHSSVVYILRHARSTANELEILATDPEICAKEYGLVPKGIEQAKAAAVKFFEENLSLLDPSNENNYKIEMYSSPFLRTKQTSEYFLEELINLLRNKWKDFYKNDFSIPIEYDMRLIERGGGETEGKVFNFFFVKRVNEF
jgi:broad specificity phosphatase PhoE